MLFLFGTYEAPVINISAPQELWQSRIENTRQIENRDEKNAALFNVLAEEKNSTIFLYILKSAGNVYKDQRQRLSFFRYLKENNLFTNTDIFFLKLMIDEIKEIQNFTDMSNFLHFQYVVYKIHEYSTIDEAPEHQNFKLILNFMIERLNEIKEQIPEVQLFRPNDRPNVCVEMMLADFEKFADKDKNKEPIKNIRDYLATKRPANAQRTVEFTLPAVSTKRKSRNCCPFFKK